MTDAFAKVYGVCKPYAITGSLPCIRELQVGVGYKEWWEGLGGTQGLGGQGVGAGSGGAACRASGSCRWVSGAGLCWLVHKGWGPGPGGRVWGCSLPCIRELQVGFGCGAGVRRKREVIHRVVPERWGAGRGGRAWGAACRASGSCRWAAWSTAVPALIALVCLARCI